MAFIVKQAGGLAVDNSGTDVLDLVPENVHERSTCWMGSREDVEELKQYLKKDMEREENERRRLEEGDDVLIQRLAQ